MMLLNSIADTTQARKELFKLCETVNHPPPEIAADVEWFKGWLPRWRASKSLDEALPSLEMLVALQGEVQAIIWPRVNSRGARLTTKFNRRSNHPELALIARLVTNSLCDKFAGPCPRCKGCFVQVRRGQTYCSRKCHSAVTASEAQKTRNVRIRRKKLEYVANAKHEYERLYKGRNNTRRPPWKKWVAQKSTELMLTEPRHPYTKNEKKITPTFLTVNKVTMPKGAK